MNGSGVVRSLGAVTALGCAGLVWRRGDGERRRNPRACTEAGAPRGEARALGLRFRLCERAPASRDFERVRREVDKLKATGCVSGTVASCGLNAGPARLATVRLLRLVDRARLLPCDCDLSRALSDFDRDRARDRCDKFGLRGVVKVLVLAGAGAGAGATLRKSELGFRTSLLPLVDSVLHERDRARARWENLGLFGAVRFGFQAAGRALSTLASPRKDEENC